MKLTAKNGKKRREISRELYAGVYIVQERINQSAQYKQFQRRMQNSQMSVFHLMTKIEQILKTYNQSHLEIDQLSEILRQLKKLRLSAEKIFQQLVPNRQQLTRLKLTLSKQIFKASSKYQLQGLEKQTEKPLQLKENIFVDSKQIQEVIQKITAIKGETMFVNQEMSVQSLQELSDSSQITLFGQTSLRKLIKEFMRKCKLSTRLPFLTPLCIRLIVLQETLLVYLGKSLSLVNKILEDERQKMLERRQPSVNTIKSVSSLSASIQHFLQRQSQMTEQLPTPKTSINLPQCRSFQPVIRSDFLFGRELPQRPLQMIDSQMSARRQNCCLWF